MINLLARTARAIAHTKPERKNLAFGHKTCQKPIARGLYSPWQFVALSRRRFTASTRQK